MSKERKRCVTQDEQINKESNNKGAELAEEERFFIGMMDKDNISDLDGKGSDSEDNSAIIEEKHSDYENKSTSANELDTEIMQIVHQNELLLFWLE